VVETPRCGVAARAAAGGTNRPQRPNNVKVAPLNMAPIARRAFFTSDRLSAA